MSKDLASIQTVRKHKKYKYENQIMRLGGTGKIARPSGIIALIVIELVIGILGIASGLSLLANPSGRGMGLDVVLDKVPLADFTLIGVWFLLAYGLLPALLAFGFWIRRHWAWTIALILAIIQLVWVVGQIYWVGAHVLQLIIGIIALLTICLLYRPTVKAYFR